MIGASELNKWAMWPRKRPFQGVICRPRLVLAVANLPTNFEVFMSNGYKICDRRRTKVENEAVLDS